MRKTLVIATAALFVVATLLPAVAGEAEAEKGMKEVKLVGYITDTWCGAKNANAEGAACAKKCAKDGSDLAIYSDGKMYILSDKEMALKHIGYKVEVTGTLGEGDKITVREIKKSEEKA